MKTTADPVETTKRKKILSRIALLLRKRRLYYKLNFYEIVKKK
jgi:hypothetical protein